jgi:hypothetical protein
MATVSPCLPIGVEDTMTQQWRERSPSATNTVVFKLQTQDRLDVFRLDRCDSWSGADPGVECVSHPLEALLILLEKDMVLGIARHYSHHVNPKKWVFVKDMWIGFAAMLFLEALSGKVECNPSVQDVRKEGTCGNENDG